MAKFERQMSARPSELVRWVDEAVIGGLEAELVDSSVLQEHGVRVHLWCLKISEGSAALQLVAGEGGLVTVTAISACPAFIEKVETLLDEFLPQRS